MIECPEKPETQETPGTVELSAGRAGAGIDRAARTIAQARLDSTLTPAAPSPSISAGSAESAAVATDHVSTATLWRFMVGGLEPAEMRTALHHLLQGCPRCQEMARTVWNLTPAAAGAFSVRLPLVSTGSATSAAAPTAPVLAEAAPAPASPSVLSSSVPAALVPSGGAQAASSTSSSNPSNSAESETYDSVLDRVFSRITIEEAAVDAGRRRASLLQEELMQHPPARQKLLVHNSARFRDRMLCESLVTASHEAGFSDPSLAQHFAGLSVAIAEALCETETVQSDSAMSPEIDLLATARVRAWAQLGNARRIGADHGGASVAFSRVEVLLAATPRIGQLDKARVLDLHASLLRDQRHLVEAGRLLDRVVATYRRMGQSNLLGRALNQKALVLGELGDLTGSISLLRRSLDLLDPREDPRWFLTVRHNLIVALVADGRPREAFALLFHTRPLYLKLGERIMLLRLRWLEGVVAQGLLRFEQAEAAFHEVRAAFVELGLDYDAAVVTLDLAMVFAQQGRTDDMRRLAMEMMTFFESHQIHREAMAAFLVFCNAAKMETAGVGLVREVGAFLKIARNAPNVRFTPPV